MTDCGLLKGLATEPTEITEIFSSVTSVAKIRNPQSAIENAG